MAVYKRGETYYTNFRFQGQRIRRPTGQKERRAAQRREDEIRAQVKAEAGELVKNAMRPRTMGDAMIRWIQEEKPESQLHHARIVSYHIPDNTPLRDVPDLAMDMRFTMDDDGLQPTTINRRLQVCVRILNLAFKRWRWIDAPLAQYIEKMSEANTQREVTCTYAQLMKLLSEIRDEECRRMAMAAAFTGFRKSELLKLQPEDWTAPYATIRKAKGGKPRRVPVAAQLHFLMEPLPFSVTSDQYRYQLDQARKRADMWHIRGHDLRHIFSTWLGNMPEMPATVLQSLMGHADLSTTSRYTHARDAVDLVELLYARVTESSEKRPH